MTPRRPNARPSTQSTAIPDLVLLELRVQLTDAGWVSESWHRAAHATAGMPPAEFVQHNLASFEQAGTTRGIHAEPWSRLVTLITGSMFCAWVDLRPGTGFGQVVACELTPGTAVFIPEGVGNSFQVLEPVITSTLLTAHWTPEARARYLSVDPFDPALAIDWPIPAAEAIRPDEPPYPLLSEVTPWQAAAAPQPARDASAPFKVLFVCTANICRSAYADVAARAAGPRGVEFASAGTHALVGEGIDPPMAHELQGRGAPELHVARQLTRAMVEEADLVIAMAARHRRYILDEWPALGRKTYLIGHVARVLKDLPESVTGQTIVDHLWSHRTSDPGDEVADPYGRGQEAAQVAARQIDGDLEVILPVLRDLVAERA